MMDMERPLVLVVDDERDIRRDLVPSGTDVVVCRSSSEAISSIREISDSHRPVEQIWFDHDLGGDDTIMPFVHEIVELHQRGLLPPVGQFVVHTSNPVGAELLMKILEDVGNTVRVYAGTYLEVRQ